MKPCHAPVLVKVDQGGGSFLRSATCNRPAGHPGAHAVYRVTGRRLDVETDTAGAAIIPINRERKWKRR